MELRSVPITIGLFYREYERLLRAGALRLENVGCPDDVCRAAGGCVELTVSTVARGLVLLERDESGELEMVSLAASRRRTARNTAASSKP